MRENNIRGWRRAVLAGVCLLAGAGVVTVGPERDAAAQSGSSTSESHPLVAALKLARSSQQALKEIRDYECTFSKRELVDGRFKSQTMEMKLRERPFSVYLLFRQPSPGREVLYVDGQNRNMLLAHEGSGVKSLVGTVSLDPHSPDAMDDSRHPITKIGLANLLESVIAQWEQESKYGETEVKYYPNATIKLDAKGNAVECKVIESKHPVPRNQFKHHMTRLFIDRTTNLPVRVEQYGWPVRGQTSPPLVEEYTYTNIRPNVGLSDLDFDVRNQKYAF